FAYLEAGLAQRGRLLQAVLKDVYGPRRLLAEGLLPAELVFNNAGFLRACRTTGPVPRPPMLSVLATDLQRGQDGQWRVAGDSIARMAGLAQALENRRLLARTMPELFRRVPLRPMRPFLEAWQLSLRHALPPGHEEDAIALLTPAVGDPSWAENVVLTQALDCIPVEPGDLTVRRGRLYLKTLRGLQPIGALLRRMQGHLLDPLESDGPAAGGVVGLMDAARNGAVRIVNDPGADMAEAPALAAFLPRLCELLLDEALRLPGLRTLWLGDPAALEEVRAAPERWMLRSATDPRSPAVLLDLSNQALLARLEAR
ncbi:circularly permuted type 2 ATP-grasp protein, partial [Roseomonas sp. DSM 102946]|nr:circularly permuted type 2 ATP-grasp protein [Roseomonas sp. DSM 102946]